MSEFTASFPKGELTREIALRGLTQAEFAAKAGVTATTILKASRGLPLHPRTWGKILIALGAVPPAEIPAGLVEQSA